MKISARNIVLIGLFAALTAVGAFVSIPVGPVPITLQTLFVILGGILLGPKFGALSQIIYILLGLIGLPIFSGFTGGAQIIFKPNFGFIVGFVFAAYIVGKISEVNSKSRIWLASITGTIVIYLFGLPYMYYVLSNLMGMDLTLYALLKMGLFMFLPGDILKLIVASIVGIKLRTRIKRME